MNESAPKRQNAPKPGRILLYAITAVLALSLFALLIVGVLGYIPASLLDKDEIEERIEECDESYTTVRRYLKAYGIGNLRMQKLSEVERCYDTYFLKDLPDPKTLATETAKVFLENYYDAIDKSDRDEVTDAVISSYVTAISDKYGVYRNAEDYSGYIDSMSGSYVGIGVTVQYSNNDKVLKIVDVLKGSPAENAGILPDDIILAVDGTTHTEVGPQSLADLIRGEAGTSLTLTILRGGSEISVTLTRAALKEQVVDYRIEDGIGYISITRFKSTTADQFEAALNYIKSSGAEGVIFDLRGNPGGYLDSVIDCLSLLVPKGTPIVSYGYKNSEPKVIRSNRSGGIDLPITVICDGITASAGELFCAAIRDWRNESLISATIVGLTTYGKGVMQSSFKLKDGSALTFTVAYYNPPSGENYDGVGVIPDVEVTVADDDAQLSVATSELKKLINANNN